MGQNYLKILFWKRSFGYLKTMMTRPTLNLAKQYVETFLIRSLLYGGVNLILSTSVNLPWSLLRFADLVFGIYTKCQGKRTNCF